MRLLPHRDHAFRRLPRAATRWLLDRLGRHRDRSRGPGAAGSPSRPQVVFVSGEPKTAGHAYRIDRMARSAAEAGWTPLTLAVADLEPRCWAELAPAPRFVVLWRVRHRPMVERAITAWRQAGATILFDVDDLMIDPAVSRPDVIDAIRSLRLDPAAVADLYAGIRRTMLLADACLAPTAPLAAALEAAGRPAFVIENGFDDETLRRSRAASLARRAQPTDGLVRIGYAAGSRTHQRDFAVAAPAIAAVLRDRPECRLVLFRRPGRDGPLLDVEEFPEFVGVADRIEWREAVPLALLPEELARFDINIAPLEVGNVFCEAKSELKYFEAALVGVPTVASPTVPFRTAIRDGETGLLATDTADWRRQLARLVDDRDLRHRLGQGAFHDVLHRHGPDGRRERIAAVFARLLGDAVVGHPSRLPRPTPDEREPLPVVPETEIVLRAGGTRPAEVAVIVPLHNYEELVAATLDSVAAQSLAELELVVVDDRSTDRSLDTAAAWLAAHAGRFVRVTLARNRVNHGVAVTRNAGFAIAEAPLIFPLDADNILEPDCLERLAARLHGSPASAAHPTLRHFGDRTKCRRARPWSPERLARGNYIDAMALVRKTAWARVGGYRKGGFTGWEDYDLWCRFVEHGLWSLAVPEAVAGYRVHARSMLQRDTAAAMDRVVAAIRAEHPWLTVRAA
jgi:GT2 family glycosyltransferase/glycosyltransferase involved in cell wall biosynthesis